MSWGFGDTVTAAMIVKDLVELCVNFPELIEKTRMIARDAELMKDKYEPLADAYTQKHPADKAL
jgi:hypothetical protein